MGIRILGCEARSALILSFFEICYSKILLPWVKCEGASLFREFECLCMEIFFGLRFLLCSGWFKSFFLRVQCLGALSSRKYSVVFMMPVIIRCVYAFFIKVFFF